ncbi:hypothetical protein TELCIR_25599 [Teladorsagia circumcincta]|uniref:Uncharacterized protein n=1 Tax=Teladorsagia circumcincta TaxID=45464 RepID=A0A2G9T6A5_TELCI|nr:hypothetical protein TELCIR_25599 [Teladorsagia circumcincta]
MIRSQIRKLRESIEFAKIGRLVALAVAHLIHRDVIAGFKTSVAKKCRRSVGGACITSHYRSSTSIREPGMLL